MEMFLLTLAVVGLALVCLCALALCAAAVTAEWEDGEVVVRRIRSRGKTLRIDPDDVCQSCGAEGFRLIRGRCDGCREADRPERSPA